MTTTHTFVRKHNTTHLPMKYVRLSMHTLLHREQRHADAGHLDKIGKDFAGFIETPIHRTDK